MTNILQLYNSGCVMAEGCGKEPVSIDVKRFTVLLGGVFDGIEEIVEERLKPKQKIGFGSEITEDNISASEWIQQVTKEDLVDYGMLPELLGRIGTILSIPPLTLEDYRQLLLGENGSLQWQYQNYLRGLYGVSLTFTDAAADSIAQLCIDGHSGARAATPIVNEQMRNALADVERDDQINRVILDADGKELHVRYEYGKRGYCYRKGTGTEWPVYRIKDNNCIALAKRLCRYYRKSGGDEKFLPTLQAFLECTLEYLSANAMDEEFCFDSLESLARTVKHDPRCSKYEILMEGCNIAAFPRFCELYTDSTQRDIVRALQRIMDYLQVYHGLVQIQFIIKQGGK